jgi:predicted lipid-binding transport protein (Tim44 family)
MSDAFDIYTVVFLVLAVFIVLRLRSVLGTRTGNEPPPYDPYTRSDAQPNPASANENVVKMPPRNGEPAEPEPALAQPWKGIAPEGSALASGHDPIHEHDRDVTRQDYLKGASAAYEMIVTAFAQGDTRTLKGLLVKDVYDDFAQVIGERQKRNETVETRFVSLDKATIQDASLQGGTANVTVGFTSSLITVTRDKDGVVIDGSPDTVTDVHDVWTFARDTASHDPNWRLVATGDA